MSGDGYRLVAPTVILRPWRGRSKPIWPAPARHRCRPITPPAVLPHL